MANWLIYLRERFPLPVYALLVGGLALSGNYAASDAIAWLPMLWAFFGLLLFFALLRLMDELKDYKKDLIAHPDRPLPRGVLTVDQVRSAIHGMAAAMVAISIASGVLLNWIAGFLYLFITIHLWLMYKEFYLGERLASRPLLYAITHQIILLPICMFTVAVARPELGISFLSLRYGFLVLGAFFTYEVCRKLDPKADPILKTYLEMYGPGGVALLVAVLSGIAARAAGRLGLEWMLWPLDGLVLLSLPILFVRPSKYKLIEGAATLSLLFHIWGITFRQWLQSLGVLS